MKPLIYVTKSLPKEIISVLEENFRLSFWEEEDLVILEQAVEQAEIGHNKHDFIEA